MTENQSTPTSGKLAVIIAIGVVIAGLLIVGTCCYLVATGGGMTFIKAPENTDVTPGNVATVTPVTTTYPTTITYTVYETHAAQYNSAYQIDREFTVQTTDNVVLVFPDYFSWRDQYPNEMYTCQVTGTQEGYGTIYTVDNCDTYPYSPRANVLYPQYRYNENQYYVLENGEYDYNTGYEYGDRYILDDPDADIHVYTYYTYAGSYSQCDSEGGNCEDINRDQTPTGVVITVQTPQYVHKH